MKVVITGTSNGIGLATAKLFLEHGHDVHGIDLLPAAIHAPRYVHHQADMTVPGTLPALDGTEILICNAGVQTGTARDIEVNLQGTMAVAETYAFQPAIRSVLFNASVSALTGDEFPTYAASKAGQVAMMKSMSKEVAKRHITVNCVSPGFIDTDFISSLPHEQLDAYRKSVPMKRFGTPEDVANAILFFASEESAYITGSVLEITGGLA